MARPKPQATEFQLFCRIQHDYMTGKFTKREFYRKTRDLFVSKNEPVICNHDDWHVNELGQDECQTCGELINED